MTSPAGLLPPAIVKSPPLVLKVPPVASCTAPATGARTTLSLPLVEVMPAPARNSMLFGAVSVSVASPPVVLAMPAWLMTRLLAVDRCHWFSAGP